MLYKSGSLIDAEKNYLPLERECLAIVYGFEQNN